MINPRIVRAGCSFLLLAACAIEPNERRAVTADAATDTSAVVSAIWPASCADSAVQAPVDAFFATITGPSGARDWAAFDTLFLPDARVDAMGIDEQGENAYHPQSVSEYGEHIGAYVASIGYYHTLLERETHCYGRIASVSGRFESRNEPAGEVIDRAIITFQLIRPDSVWRIAHVMWNSATPANPLPE